ncbi:geranyl diphosphate synthase small subunit, partial [Genlisea aurea]
SYWEGIQCDVQLYLKEAIPRGPPEAVYEPMRHLTFAAPTTTASSLCVAACELVGGDRKQAIAAAAALHLMHAALYAHEHLPLTEGHPPSRRPIEHRYGPNIELLTGDGLIPFGVELVAQSMDPSSNNHDRILKVIIEITRATGSQGMVDGLYRRKNLELHSDSDITELEYVCKKIEGEIHACGGACGAILGGAGEEEIERLRKFGLLVGTI